MRVRKLPVFLTSTLLGAGFITLASVQETAEENTGVLVRETGEAAVVGETISLEQDSFYIIYNKCVKKPATPSGMLDLLDQVGKPKIVASLDELTIGRFIAAHDIIQKGDLVLLRREP